MSPAIIFRFVVRGDQFKTREIVTALAPFYQPVILTVAERLESAYG
jgi:hypothetical protein